MEDNQAKGKSEKKLFKDIKKRNKDAFIKAYDFYADDIYRFIYFKVSDTETAQDITSAVFLKTWNYIQENDLKDFKTFRALIYTIARTSVIDHYRKSSLATVSIDNENAPDVQDEKENIARQAEINSDLEKMMEKLGELKEEYREVLTLKYIDELSIAEIAKVLDKSKGSIRVSIHRALAAMRELMG